LIVQNDVGNQYSPTTIVLAITSQISKARLPTHIELSRQESGLERDSVVLAEQIRTIDKARLQHKVAELNKSTMSKVEKGLSVSVGLTI